MYIPGWLIFIGVAVAMVASKRLRDAVLAGLGAILVFGVGILLLGLVAFALYYTFSDMSHALGVALGAAVFTASFLITRAVGRFVLSRRDLRDTKGRLRLGALRRRLNQHQRKAARVGPAALVETRLAFALEIALGDTLFNLHAYIQYLFWHAEAGKVSWSSQFISTESLRLESLCDLERFDLEVAEDAKDEECLTYAFSASGKSFVLCACAEDVPAVTCAPTLGGTLQALRVFVIDLPSHVVLEALIIYEDAGENSRFHQVSIDAFRPGDWLVELMRVSDGVDREYHSFLKGVLECEARVEARRFA